MNTPPLQAHQTQLPGKGLRGVKNIIAIASGKGGVGKSTVTVNLAVALSKTGARVGILDADIYGPSIPQMLGQNTPVEINTDSRYIPVQAHGIQAMSMGYLTADREAPLMWRGPMLAKSLIQMLDITAWDNLDYLLIDLPPGTGDIQLSLVQKIPLTAGIIVTTPQTVATADAEKALLMFEQTNIHVLGLVENMAEHICSNCGHHSALFGTGGADTLSKKHNATLLGQLPLHAQIRENSDSGQPTALQANTELTHAFQALALNVDTAIRKRPLNYADKFPPIVTE
jgi:ATP-binding protein involved in chromosome partitioning|tara:strand:- start:33822 stop:34676 length:855 start_codon:yes stop_codon:yes gene_type:complete